MEELLKKRDEVLNAIYPIMKAFNITDYDYIVKDFGQRETLIINGTGIGCSCNSIEAIINEIIKYLFVGCCNNSCYLGTFRNSVLKKITEYWLSDVQTKEIIGFKNSKGV